MRPDDFFVEDLLPDEFGMPTRHANVGILAAARQAPLPDHSDIEVAVPLARLVHDELEKYGTDGRIELSEGEMRHALLALRAVALRIGIAVDLPFRDYSTFRGWWIRQGARGSWQARRDLLAEIFDPLHDQLADLEQQTVASTLAQPVSPHARTGWPSVDTEVSELRRHFQNARTEQDYRNVGNDCVAVLEALSRTVYDPAKHLREDETEPAVDKTKQRIGRFIEDALPGADNAELRKLATANIELAHKIKHRQTPTRRDAGIAADAVIQLANILRRLEEEV